MVKLFIRTFKRHLALNVLNLAGLSLGMAAFIYMISYASFEQSFDKHHKDHHNIFRVSSQKIQDGNPEARSSSTSVALSPFLNESIPEVEEAVRVHIFDIPRQIFLTTDLNGQLFKNEETAGYHADANYFEILSDKILSGNAEGALDDPFDMVLTERLAKKYFGNENPVGKTITMIDEAKYDYKITAVVEDVPANNHFQYDYLISLKTLQTVWPRARWESWDWDYFHTYIKIQPGIDPIVLTQKINDAVAVQGAEFFSERNFKMDYELQPLTDIHLHSHLGRELSENGNGRLLSFIYMIAFFILILAWVNYINLTTAKSVIRAKEVGIRKVNGAHRLGLIKQFLLESVIINLLGLLISLLILFFVEPLVQHITGFVLDWNTFLSLPMLVTIIPIILSGSLVSGFYPAIVLSGFEPLTILKGNFHNSAKGVMLRKALVVFQFAVSVIIIGSTLIVFQQIDFLSNRNLGISMDQVLAVNTPNVRSDEFWQEYDYLKSQLSDDPNIQAISASNQRPGDFLYHTELFKKGYENRVDADVMKMVWIDYDFLKLYGLNLMSGRTYNLTRSGDERALLLNESAAKLIGFDSPDMAIDQPVTWVHSYGDLDEMKVIGVVNDYDQHALGSAEPMAFLMNRHWWWKEAQYFLFKINSDQQRQTIAQIEQVFSSLYPEESFTYRFVNEFYNQQYQSELKFGKIMSLFTILAIVISFLGLFGLVTFLVIQRTKEISIRKILGASVKQITTFFVSQFMAQVLFACLIAIPFTWIAMEKWLDRFVYRMELNPWLLLAPAMTVCMLAATIISFQSLKAAQSNPTENLRNE